MPPGSSCTWDTLAQAQLSRNESPGRTSLDAMVRVQGKAEACAQRVARGRKGIRAEVVLQRAGRKAKLLRAIAPR